MPSQKLDNKRRNNNCKSYTIRYYYSLTFRSSCPFSTYCITFFLSLFPWHRFYFPRSENVMVSILSACGKMTAYIRSRVNDYCILGVDILFLREFSRLARFSPGRVLGWKNNVPSSKKNYFTFTVFLSYARREDVFALTDLSRRNLRNLRALFLARSVSHSPYAF